MNALRELLLALVVSAALVALVIFSVLAVSDGYDDKNEPHPGKQVCRQVDNVALWECSTVQSGR